MSHSLYFESNVNYYMQAFQKNWEANVCMCPNSHRDGVLSIEEQPPEDCPYILEQTVAKKVVYA